MIDLKEAMRRERSMDAASKQQQRYASLVAEAESLGYKLVKVPDKHPKVDAAEQEAKDAIKAQLKALGVSPKGNPSLATLQAMLEEAQGEAQQEAQEEPAQDAA